MELESSVIGKSDSIFKDPMDLIEEKEIEVFIAREEEYEMKMSIIPCYTNRDGNYEWAVARLLFVMEKKLVIICREDEMIMNGKLWRRKEENRNLA